MTSSIKDKTSQVTYLNRVVMIEKSQARVTTVNSLVVVKTTAVTSP